MRRRKRNIKKRESKKNKNTRKEQKDEEEELEVEIEVEIEYINDDLKIDPDDPNYQHFDYVFNAFKVIYYLLIGGIV